MTQIFQRIQNTQQWDEQVKLLESIKIEESTAKLLNFPKNSVFIKDLLLSPRSKVLTTTIQFVNSLIEKYGFILHNFVLFLLSSDCLFRLLHSAKNIISSQTNELIKTIIITCPHSQFYNILINELQSKNGNVREHVSSYLLILADMIEIPSNLEKMIKKWKNDQREKVRRNIQFLLQVASNKKMSQKIRKQNKQNINDDKKKEKSQEGNKKKSIFTNKSQNLIMDSFQSQINENSDYTEINQTNIGVNYFDNRNLQFLLHKIELQDAWNIRILVIKQFFDILCNAPICRDLLQDCFKIIVKLLDERRNRVYESAFKALNKILTQYEHEVIFFIDDFAKTIVQKSVKTQTTTMCILPKLINLNPTKYIVLVAQLTIDIKSIKQKTMLLDVLTQAICSHTIPSSKISPILKLILQLFSKYPHQKQVYLPSMTIFSHFKVTHPQQLMSCLISQDNHVISQILSIADQIDVSLRDGILNFFNNFKPSQKKKEFDSIQNGNLEQLLVQIKEVEEEKEGCVEALGVELFENLEKLECKDFYIVIKLSEDVVSQNVFLDLQLLLNELCKVQNKFYLDALFMAIDSCSSDSIESEYVQSYLEKIQFIAEHFPQLMGEVEWQKVINIYRFSKNAKVRLLCVKCLSLMDEEMSCKVTNKKEKQLIDNYVKIKK